jgi:hypothetical protein
MINKNAQFLLVVSSLIYGIIIGQIIIIFLSAVWLHLDYNAHVKEDGDDHHDDFPNT